MMVSTLSMGFVITGALISLSGTANLSQGKVVEFVTDAWKAFMFALAALALSFMISTIGGQIHSIPGRTSAATRFFIIVSPLMMIAEVCCPFYSGAYTLMYMEEYISLVFVNPLAQLCPGGLELTITASDAQTAKFGQNRFCAKVGADFYDAAASMCGPPRNPPRAFNVIDTKSWVCSQLDYNSIGKARFWFGWTLESAFEAQPAYHEDLGSCQRRQWWEHHAGNGGKQCRHALR